MSIVGYIRKTKLSSGLKKITYDYQKSWDTAARLDYQLLIFNENWQNIFERVPYYAKLVQSKDLPVTFNNWDEFVQKVPITTKDMVQRKVEEMSDQLKKPDYYRITGGTTAQPVQMPAWSSENKITELNMWMARKWYGINPDSKLFKIWGHSHIFGAGFKGKINSFKRKLKDWLLDYYRFSAYDLKADKMRLAAEKMLKFKPDGVFGYSVALDLFAHENKDLEHKLKSLGIKVVTGAVEAFPNDNSEQLIGELFNCPVAMEYGSVETNLIAHTHPSGGYKVFWQSYFLEATENSDGKGKILRITSLYPRCFPLVRYEIGDEIEIYDGDDEVGIYRFKKVIGRCNSFIMLKDGTKVHSEAITHCIRDCPEIARYQLIQSRYFIKLLLIERDGYSKRIEENIKERLRKIHPDLYNIQFERVHKLQQTIAGKTPMIIRYKW